MDSNKEKAAKAVGIEPLVICTLWQTCKACPSQWEGKLADDRMIYIRYRWGSLSIRISHKPTNNISNAVGGNQIYFEHFGDTFDGFLGKVELIKKTAHILQYPKSV